MSSARRAAVLLCGTALFSSILAGALAGPAGASGSQSTKSTRQTTTTTTAAKPKTTTTTTTTTVSKPKTTTTVAIIKPSGANRSGHGVPKVPVSGPPTTVGPKGTQPPAAPNPAPILSAVQADLSQLTAIADYKSAVSAVNTAQADVTTAGLELQSGRADVTGTKANQQQAQTSAANADTRMRNLAIAAYMGISYATPAAGPQAVQDSNLGTVSSPEGLTGVEAAVADEDLRLVGQRARQGVQASGQVLTDAKAAAAQAQKELGQAQAGVTKAESDLLASQQALKIITDAATTPGAAATLDLMTLPGTEAQTASPPTELPGAVDAAANLPVPTSPTILGQSMMTGAQLAAWFASTGRKANVTVPMAKLAADYQAAGKATGVRFDLAFAQSVVETGYFSFPSYGQLTAKDNNFAGIGACDSCATGWTFPTAQAGVGAQLELLEAYASPKVVATPLLGHPVGVGGCCSTWMALSGTWASNPTYGIEILTIYNEMLTWVIPQKLVAAGLIGTGDPPAPGPSLAALPDTKESTAPATKSR